MNKPKEIIISFTIVITLSIIIIISGMTSSQSKIPNNVYQIYLDGNKIGMINDKDEFYDLINQEQSDIKDLYNVNQVYPPRGFEIVEYKTYDEDLSSSSKIYEQIKDERDFTIKGYTITVKKDATEENEKPKIMTINVLDKSIFNEAILKYINTFLESGMYDDYLNGTQKEVVDTGELLKDLKLDETITIKENYISVTETIFTDTNELVKKLLYGDEMADKEYIVKKGDSLESIAFDNKLNISEILIANDDIKSENSIIAVGQPVNVAMVSPQLTLVYNMDVTEIIEEPYDKEIKYDDSYYPGYSKIQTKGVPGLTKITKEVTVVNGVANQDAVLDPDKVVTIRLPQNEVRIYGSYSSSGGYVDTGYQWGLPTNFPYSVTSPYGYRWGVLHDGIDISGTGYGSPIYSVLEGEVISAGWGGMLGNSAGYNVVIKHANNYYSGYAHLSKVNVSVGQVVTKGEVIGGMGNSGFVTGTHLHLGIFRGLPYNGGTSINPATIIRF